MHIHNFKKEYATNMHWITKYASQCETLVAQCDDFNVKF